ncbi:MAG: hypothetical protein HDR88_06665 [Bacteroides sp.]|nr:hypothetical protein [Bacteroides sp.]
MRKYLMAIVFAIVSMAAYAKPHCHHFNNHDNKITVIFTDKDTDGEYIVSDVKLIPISGGKEYEVISVDTTLTDSVAKVILTFPHLTQFSDPIVELSINGKKTNFKVFQIQGSWK